MTRTSRSSSIFLKYWLYASLTRWIRLLCLMDGLHLELDRLQYNRHIMGIWGRGSISSLVAASHKEKKSWLLSVMRQNCWAVPDKCGYKTSWGAFLHLGRAQRQKSGGLIFQIYNPPGKNYLIHFSLCESSLFAQFFASMMPSKTVKLFHTAGKTGNHLWLIIAQTSCIIHYKALLNRFKGISLLYDNCRQIWRLVLKGISSQM